MILYFVLAVCVVLAIAIGRIIVDYAGKSDTMSTTVKAHQRLIDEHVRDTKQLQARAKEARKQIHALVKSCSDLDRQIHEHLEVLQEVQDQLERRRPKARQVEVDRDEGGEANEREDTAT